MENPIKMDDLGVTLFLETSSWWFQAKDSWTHSWGDSHQSDSGPFLKTHDI